MPRTRAVLFDVTPRQLFDLAGEHFTEGYNSALKRYRYGPGIFKVDFALDGPIPWAAEGCNRAGTVHLGGTLDEVAAGEGAVSRGEHPERPFILLAQQSLFDPTRAPDGKHTVWAYFHVPNGSTFDITGRIEAQIERFAPGFRDLVLAKSVAGPADLERQNPNLVGGDITGGSMDLRQLFTRPLPGSTPIRPLPTDSTSAPPRRRRGGACTACAAIWPPAWPCATSSNGAVSRPRPRVQPPGGR